MGQLQLRDELANSTKDAISALMDLWAVVKHYGPGPHPGTGTDQSVHGTGGGPRAQVLEIDVRPREELQTIAYDNLLNAFYPLWVSTPTEIAQARGVTLMYIAADGRIWELPGEYMHQGAANEGLKGIEDEVAELANMDGDPISLMTYGLGFIRSVAFNSDRGFIDGELMVDVRRKPTRKQIETIEDILAAYRVEGIEPKFKWDWMSKGRYFAQETGIALQRLKDVAGVVRHYGPGAHPGTGTSQDVHGKEASGILSWQDENIEHIPKKMGRGVPEGMDYRPGRWLGLHSEGMGDVFREFAKEHDYGGRISWSYIEEKLGRLEDDMDRERDNELIFEGELSSEDDARRQEMHRLWESFPGELSPQLEAAKHLNLRLLERDKTGVILAIRDVRSFEEWESTLRHYGPGPHPGTGTSQDVHGPLSSVVAKLELEMGVQRIPAPKNRQPIKMKLWRGESKRTPVDEGMYGKGIYFSPHRHYAEGYAYGGKLIEAEVFLKTPFVGEYNEVKELGRAAKQAVFEAGGTIPEANRASSIAIRKTLEEQGYDGIIIITTSNSVRPNTVNEVIVFWKEGYTTRHYGPGVHPGTGTSQDVHGGNGGPQAGKVQMTSTSRKQSGLGDFRIDRPAPSQNNSIVFDDEELRAKGYSEEVIEQQREWFFANVSAAIMKMEDEMDIEITGMEVTNSVMDLAERQAGPLVMGHPTRREAFLGRLREDTDEWLGGYYKGIVWLDDNHQGELLSGPEDIDFRLTVHHEVGHFLTARDGRAKFSADYVVSMSDGTYVASEPYRTGAMLFYGKDLEVIDDEYRADLVASYPVLHQEWIRGFLPAMTEHDKRNQVEIVASLIDEAEFVTELLSRTEEAEEDDDVLVFFPRAGEIRGVPRAALRNLPKDAVILSEVFKK